MADGSGGRGTDGDRSVDSTPSSRRKRSPEDVALGRDGAGAGPPSSSAARTADAPDDDGPPSSSAMEEAARARERRYAARRNSLVAQGAVGADGVPRSRPRKPAGRPKWALWALAAALVAVLAVGAVHAKRTIDDGSEGGRVRNALIAWEFAPREPAAREAAFVAVDDIGPAAVSIAIELLLDDRGAAKDGSHSTRRIQEIANAYLLRCAANANAAPPSEATRVSQQIFDGAYPPQPVWSSLRDAWRKWLDDARERGLLPKA